MNACAIILLLAAAPPNPVDFDTEVLPVLAKAGCNAGACHGAAAGRGGFKLSLFGGDPAADYRQIVHELEGRRVNLAHPERSLLLLKPTWQLDHEGGERFAADSPQAKLLTDWIAAGALRESKKTLVGIRISYSEEPSQALPRHLTLHVSASFSDGSTRPVTESTIFSPADPAATVVDDKGRVQVLSPGRHTIVVRHLTQVAAMQITVPYPGKRLKTTDMPRSNWIDDEINSSLQELRIPPAPRADDATLLRRVTLDLTGRLPAPGRVLEYLSDQDEHKFDAEVERLIASPDFIEYWTYRLAEWLRFENAPREPAAQKAYYDWLKQQATGFHPL
ncbi:MAG TPA: DUF1549 domain-containing protein, partial [Pirellulaceae bacterium]|nr:DUF1549 domain-containing protein [Pirellulaceae bacterium]